MEEGIAVQPKRAQRSVLAPVSKRNHAVAPEAENLEVRQAVQVSGAVDHVICVWGGEREGEFVH